MDTDRRVIDYIRDIAEYVTDQETERSVPHSIAGEIFIHTGHAVYPCCKLSGGEKRRLYLLSVLISGANVLYPG